MDNKIMTWNIGNLTRGLSPCNYPPPAPDDDGGSEHCQGLKK